MADALHSDAVDAAMSGLGTAFGNAVRALGSVAEPRAAFDQASAALQRITEMRDETAQIRSEAAWRILERDHLSLAQLAGQLGISKARAAQMIQAAKKRRPAPEESRRDAPPS